MVEGEGNIEVQFKRHFIIISFSLLLHNGEGGGGRWGGGKVEQRTETRQEHMAQGYCGVVM